MLMKAFALTPRDPERHKCHSAHMVRLDTVLQLSNEGKTVAEMQHCSSVKELKT